MEADAFVVVDVLRATSTIAVLFHRGLSDLLVVDDVEVARARAKEGGRLLFGEVGGLRPEGFDYGNSPLEARGAAIERRSAVLFTTNGTTVLCALGERGAVYAGALANAASVVRALAEHERGVVVCAGNGGGTRFSQEDFAAAGLLVQAVQRNTAAVRLGDGAALALMAAARPPGGSGGRRSMPSPGRQLIQSSSHARLLKKLGFERDVEFCTELDTAPCTPMVSACGPGWALLRNAG